MNNYELAILFHPEQTEEQVESFLSNLTSIIKKHGGDVTATNKWGKRRLAYRIQKQQEANYVFVAFTALPEVNEELNHALKVEMGVMRSMITKKVYHKPIKVKPKKAPKTEEKKAEPSAQEPAK